MYSQIAIRKEKDLRRAPPYEKRSLGDEGMLYMFTSDTQLTKELIKNRAWERTADSEDASKFSRRKPFFNKLPSGKKVIVKEADSRFIPTKEALFLTAVSSKAKENLKTSHIFFEVPLLVYAPARGLPAFTVFSRINGKVALSIEIANKSPVDAKPDLYRIYQKKKNDIRSKLEILFPQIIFDDFEILVVENEGIEETWVVDAGDWTGQRRKLRIKASL